MIEVLVPEINVVIGGSTTNRFLVDIYIYILWLFNLAMEHGPFIDGFPIKNGGSFHGELLNNQMVYIYIYIYTYVYSQCLLI